MPNPLLVSNDLSGLGRLALAHTTESNQSRARDNELAAHVLQAQQQNRLTQQQLAQNQQRDTMQTALALASLQNQKDRDNKQLAEALALSKAQSDARMNELQAQIKGNIDLANVRGNFLDPSLYGGVLNENFQTEHSNDENAAISNAANQELSAVNLQFDPQRRDIQTGNYYPNWANPLAWSGLGKTSQERGTAALNASDLARQQAINAIQAKYAGKLLYDPVNKRFTPVKRPMAQLPFRGALPSAPTPSPIPAGASQSPLTGALLQQIQAQPVAPATPIATSPSYPAGTRVVQGGITYQFDGSNWIAQ